MQLEEIHALRKQWDTELVDILRDSYNAREEVKEKHHYSFHSYGIDTCEEEFIVNIGFRGEDIYFVEVSIVEEEGINTPNYEYRRREIFEWRKGEGVRFMLEDEDKPLLLHFLFAVQYNFLEQPIDFGAMV